MCRRGFVSRILSLSPTGGPRPYLPTPASGPPKQKKNTLDHASLFHRGGVRLEKGGVQAGRWIAVFRRGWVLEPSLLNMRPALPPQRDRRARARSACLLLACRPGQAARGWRQLVIAAEHRRRGLRCWLSPRRRFHVSPAQSGAETSRKCASSQLLMDLRREPSTLFNSSAGPARPSGAFRSACSSPRRGVVL